MAADCTDMLNASAHYPGSVSCFMDEGKAAAYDKKHFHA